MTTSITPYHANYQTGVIELILGIQQNEFQLPITLEDQPDLTDIEGFYVHPGGQFWVASNQGRVVGTVALLYLNQTQRALRKMFVHPDFRGEGLAVSLLDEAIQACRELAVTEIFLGTTEQFKAAHRFYERQGFALCEPSQLPEEFPIMAVDKRFYCFEI